MINSELYELCDCGKKAVWVYMPGFKTGSDFFCDEHVPRGCSCNNRYVRVDAYTPELENPDLPTSEDGVEGRDWKWDRVKEPFKYYWNNNWHFYYPDFYLVEFDYYIEVKGYETNRDKAKWNSVENLIVIKQKEINSIKKNNFILTCGETVITAHS